jgi:hypothetical protein
MPQMRIGPLMARTMVEDGHNVKSSARASRFSSGRSSMALRTACGVSLNRRARHGAIRTEHAAIARKRFQALATSFAVIEELARVRRHGVCGPMSTLRANQGRFRDQIRLPIHPPEAMSVAQDSTGAPIRWKQSHFAENFPAPARWLGLSASFCRLSRIDHSVRGIALSLSELTGS